MLNILRKDFLRIPFFGLNDDVQFIIKEMNDIKEKLLPIDKLTFIVESMIEHASNNIERIEHINGLITNVEKIVLTVNDNLEKLESINNLLSKPSNITDFAERILWISITTITGTILFIIK